MREILFRGKRTINNEWAFGHYVVLDPVDKPDSIREPSHLIIPVESKYNSWNSYLYTHYPIVPETLGQFTGMFDIDGEKIFEGDILEREKGLFSTNERIVIRFDDSSFAYADIGWNVDIYTPICDYEYGISVDNYKVIGNIHDNPELLKKDE